MLRDTIPRPVQVLGFSGLLPQLMCLVIALSAPEWRWVALAAGCFYAALILSFLGGMWWMQALAAREQKPRTYLVAIGPTLVGWAALLPWCLGWPWPHTSLVALAAALAASPLVDRMLARTYGANPDWLRLRAAMATGLAILTLLLAVI